MTEIEALKVIDKMEGMAKELHKAMGLYKVESKGMLDDEEQVRRHQLCDEMEEIVNRYHDTGAVPCPS